MFQQLLLRRVGKPAVLLDEEVSGALELHLVFPVPPYRVRGGRVEISARRNKHRLHGVVEMHCSAANLLWCVVFVGGVE